jgi:hypothetical protein
MRMITVPVGAALFDIVNVQNWTRRWISGRSSTLASARGAAPRSFPRGGERQCAPIDPGQLALLV